MTVQASRPPSAAPLPRTGAPSPPQRIRVGGSVQASRLLVHTQPVYPPDLQRAGITGTVLLRGIIDKQGSVTNLEVTNTDVNPGLASAALEAVRHWQYE